MAVGQGSLISAFSYIALAKESTFGTLVTATAQLMFNSSSIKMLKENKILEQIERGRTYSKRIGLGRVVEGEVESYVYPRETATGWIIANAFGVNTITSATATGETIGGGAFTHTLLIGSQSATLSSFTMNVRKGPSTTGKVFEYTGMKVNEITFSGELDEALKMSIGWMGKDATQTTNDVEAQLTTTSVVPLSFVNGRISVETSFASLTSSSYWHVQSVEFGISNSIKGDSEARRIGSDTVDVLPAGIASFTLNMTIRFDTTTAYAAMMNETQLSAELEFTGPTMSGSAIREGLKFQFPKLHVSDGGDPEIGGPDEIIVSNVVFHVLRDDTSATGYAVRALLTNNLSAY